MLCQILSRTSNFASTVLRNCTYFTFFIRSGQLWLLSLFFCWISSDETESWRCEGVPDVGAWWHVSCQDTGWAGALWGAARRAQVSRVPPDLPCNFPSLTFPSTCYWRCELGNRSRLSTFVHACPHVDTFDGAIIQGNSLAGDVSEVFLIFWFAQKLSPQWMLTRSQEVKSTFSNLLKCVQIWKTISSDSKT